jgi:hypothetical protein
MPDFHHWAHREHNDGTDRDVTKSARLPAIPPHLITRTDHCTQTE